MASKNKFNRAATTAPKGGSRGAPPRTVTEVTQDRIVLARRAHPNYLVNLQPQRIRTNHDYFNRGYVYLSALMWDEAEQNDDILRSVLPKRKQSVSRLKWEICEKDTSPEAAQQADFLRFVYTNLKCVNAYDQNVTGGVPLLVHTMLDALGKKYSIHELVWSPQMGLTEKGAPTVLVEARHVPLWFFENWTGKLRFAKFFGDLNGNDLLPGQWITTAIQDGPLMRPCMILYFFKHKGLEDWLVYCGRNGMPGVVGKSDAAPGSAQWEANREAIREIGAEFNALVSHGTEIDVLDMAARGELPYPKLVERCDRMMSILCRGSDLATMSAGDHSGASLQGEESDILDESDTQLVEENLRKQLDLPALEYAFGQGVQVKAEFKLISPDRHNMAVKRANIALAYDLGLELSRNQVREDLNLIKPQTAENADEEAPEDDLLVKPPQPAGTVDPLAAAVGGRSLGITGSAANSAPAAPAVPVHDRSALAEGLRADFAPLAEALGTLADGDAPITEERVNALLARFPALAKEVLRNNAAALEYAILLDRAAAGGAAAAHVAHKKKN